MRIVSLASLLLLVGWQQAFARDLPICQHFLTSYEKDLQIASESIAAVSASPSTAAVSGSASTSMSSEQLAQKLTAGEHAIFAYSLASTAFAYAQGYHCSLDPFTKAESAFRAKYEQ